MNSPGSQASAPSFGAVRNVRALVIPVAERLLATLVAENEDIRQGRPANHDAYNLDKSQALLELNRLVTLIGEARHQGAQRDTLAKLHLALEENERLLRTQLAAARKVSSIIAEAIHAGQSDGTYSAHIWREWQ